MLLWSMFYICRFFGSKFFRWFCQVNVFIWFVLAKLTISVPHNSGKIQYHNCPSNAKKTTPTFFSIYGNSNGTSCLFFCSRSSFLTTKETQGNEFSVCFDRHTMNKQKYMFELLQRKKQQENHKNELKIDIYCRLPSHDTRTHYIKSGGERRKDW